MNIVSIMTELIGKQKISKRRSHSSASKPRGSLIATAGKIRSAEKPKRRKSVKGRISPVLRKAGKKVRSVVSLNRRPASTKQQKVVKRGIKGAGIKKILGAVRKRLPEVNTKILLVSSAVIIACLAAAYIITGYVDNQTMFNELSLYDDANINDVLYESLPSDYDGQGSGEVAGIEPVLLTSGEPMSYIVKSGDTLSEISKKNNIKIGTLISFNKITDVRRLQVGMELKIPDFDGIPYEVKAGDSLSSISKKHNTSVNSILDANNLDTDVLTPGDILYIPGAAMNEFDYKKAMGTLFIYPTSGRLSSPFGYRADPFTGARRFHNGIDLANAIGTRISATMSGVVADIGDRPSGYGKYVIIKHPNGYQSLYGHLSKITVRKGQYVSQSEKIGEMGNTGRSTGPHLHFSIYKNNTPVNPRTYLW